MKKLRINFMINNILMFVISFANIYCTSNDPQAPSELPGIKLPEGFSIDYYARDIENARSMVLGESGILFIGSRDAGNVYAVIDNDKDNKADKIITVASGLTMPNGVALMDGSLFVAERSRVIKFDDIEDKINSGATTFNSVVVNNGFPDDASHGWKFIRFGPDGKLYIPVGAPCNICLNEDDPRYASIMRMNPDGSELEVFASGIRNTVGFDWNPQNNILWFTDNGRDMLGDNVPPDELNRAPEKGMHFGYPFIHGDDIPDPEFGNGIDLTKYTKPVQKLGPHVAALGMRFYTGDMFPSEYKNQIFIAEHGSWNRSSKIGYRVALVKLNGDNAASYETFAEGWLKDGDVTGRPVDVLVMPDGALLVSDDFANCIYRISYK